MPYSSNFSGGEPSHCANALNSSVVKCAEYWPSLKLTMAICNLFLKSPPAYFTFEDSVSQIVSPLLFLTAPLSNKLL